MNAQPLAVTRDWPSFFIQIGKPVKHFSPAEDGCGDKTQQTEKNLETFSTALFLKWEKTPPHSH